MRVALLPGDGIGPDISASARRVLAELAPDLELDPSYATRAAIHVLWSQMHGGAIEKTRGELPADIRQLWPDFIVMA